MPTYARLPVHPRDMPNMTPSRAIASIGALCRLLLPSNLESSLSVPSTPSMTPAPSRSPLAKQHKTPAVSPFRKRASLSYFPSSRQKQYCASTSSSTCTSSWGEYKQEHAEHLHDLQAKSIEPIMCYVTGRISTPTVLCLLHCTHTTHTTQTGRSRKGILIKGKITPTSAILYHVIKILQISHPTTN